MFFLLFVVLLLQQHVEKNPKFFIHSFFVKKMIDENDRRRRRRRRRRKGGKEKFFQTLRRRSRRAHLLIVWSESFFSARRSPSSVRKACDFTLNIILNNFPSSSLSLSLSSLPPGNQKMIFSKEEGKEEEEEEDDDEEKEEDTNNVFGDLRENDLVETPFKRMRKTTKTTTTISKSILTKMKDLPMMDIFSSSSSRSSSSSNNNKKKQYETCALVGTAAIVTDAQRGGEIDANDAVFRTDDAPTKRYEQFVGRRATYRIVSGGGSSRSSSSSSSSTSSFFEDIVSSGEAVKEKSIVTTTTTTTTSSSSSMEGESEDESAGGNIDESEDRKVMKKYTSPFAKYLVALDDVAKEKIREALSLTDEEDDNENDDDGGEEGRGDQLTHAIALDASFADGIREAYTTAGALLNDLGENFKIRQTPPVGAFALFFALSKCNRLTLYGVPSPDSNRLETQPYWPRKTKTENGGKPTKIDIFGDRVLYALVRLFALEGFVDVVN